MYFLCLLSKFSAKKRAFFEASQTTAFLLHRLLVMGSKPAEGAESHRELWM